MLQFKRIFSNLDKSQVRNKRFNDTSVTDGLRESQASFMISQQSSYGWGGVGLAGSQVAYI